MPIPLTPTATSTILTTTTGTVTEPKESQKLFTHPVRHVVRQTIPQRDAIMEPMQPIDASPGQRRTERQNQVQERAVQNDSNENSQAVAQNLN